LPEKRYIVLKPIGDALLSSAVGGKVGVENNNGHNDIYNQ
jgi:hypothetical protein